MNGLANIELFERLNGPTGSASNLTVFNAPSYSQLHDAYVNGLNGIKTSLQRLCNECCDWLESGSGTLSNANGFLAYFDRVAGSIADDAFALPEDIYSWGPGILQDCFGE